MIDISTPLAQIIFGAILSGGLITALTSLYDSRKKTPVEVNSIIAAGAESAVLSMERVLRAETERANRAEEENEHLHAELARRDERIERLEQRLDDLQVALDRARRELHELIVSDTEANKKL